MWLDNLLYVYVYAAMQVVWIYPNTYIGYKHKNCRNNYLDSNYRRK